MFGAMVKIGMLETLRVRDVMTEPLLLLRAETSLDAAWHTLHDAGVTGAPVLNAQGRLVGVISLADFADPRRRAQALTVGDAMTRVIYAVRADDPAVTAVRLMLRENIHRVVVVDEQGALVGIIVAMDVLRALVREDESHIEFVDLRKLQAG
jgi:CBS-domain-containing membrane protein